MTDTTQPEAIRLAAELDAYHTRACHKQAAAELRRLYARVTELEAHVQKPAAIEHVATDVSKNGPESNMPDLSQLTERGAKAWAWVDAQALREGGAQAPAVPAEPRGWQVEALLDGRWEPQWPIDATREAAEKSMGFYAQAVEFRVVPVYAAAPQPEAAVDERAAFERVFPMPND